MSVLTLEDARLRGLTLPADDGVAQDIIDEQEAWLARRIGLLVGARTETFYVGLGATTGKLALSRFTDDVDVTDGGAAVDAGRIRLVDRGSAVIFSSSAPSRWWAGPYVEVAYTPSDEDEVRKAIADLVGLAAVPVGPYESETIGAYSYTRGSAKSSPVSQRAQIVSSLLPVHDAALTIHSARRLGYADPVINRAELAG